MLETDVERNDRIERAYNRLPPKEKVMIDFACNEIIAALKAKHTGFTPLMFGMKQARELLAALGVWMIDNNKFSFTI